MKYKTGRQDIAVACGLFITAVLTRVPFASRMIFEGDSARFVLAMKEFDVSQMRPHAPGYILYVALAKLADSFINDALFSLVGISIISSALTAVVLYYLVRGMYDRSGAFICVALLLSSPLYWFNGEMPLTYTLEGLCSVIFAYTCYRLVTGEKKWMFFSAIALGVATGVRQNTIVMLFPLWVFALRKYSIKDILTAFCVFGLTCLAWFMPMAMLTGGLKKYLSAVDAQYSTWVAHPSPFLFQIRERGGIFAKFITLSMSIGLVPLVYHLVRNVRIRSLRKDPVMTFLLLWFVPGTVFFIGVNIWNPGHVVVILPPLFILLAEGVKVMSKDIHMAYEKITRPVSAERRPDALPGRTLLIIAVLAILAVNTNLFIVEKTPVSRSVIQSQDNYLHELIRLTRENSEPGKTMLIAFFYNTQAGIYLPDYRIYCPLPLIFNKAEVPVDIQNVYVSYKYETTPRTYWVPTDFRVKPIAIPEGIDKIILWEEEVAGYYRNPERPLKKITSGKNGMKIFVLTVKPKENIYYDYHYLSVG